MTPMGQTGNLASQARPVHRVHHPLDIPVCGRCLLGELATRRTPDDNPQGFKLAAGGRQLPGKIEPPV